MSAENKTGPGIAARASPKGKSYRSSTRGEESVSDDVEMTIVLRIDLPVTSDRRGCVSRPDRQLLEDILFQGAVRIDSKQITVFAVGIGHPV